MGLGFPYSQKPYQIIIEVLLENQIKWKRESLKKNALSITEKKINGIKGEEYMRSLEGVSHIDYLFLRGGFWLAIGGRGEYEEILNQIIQSLQFWDPEPLIIENPDGTKTYRSKDWGFEFRFPGDWEVRQPAFGSVMSKFNFAIQPSNEKHLPDPVRINILPNDWIMQVYKKIEARGISSFEVQVNGVRGIGYEYTSEGLPQIDYFFPLGMDTTIVIGGKKQYKDVLENVLDSFKFLGDGLKLYRNEEWGFEFQYPEDWEFEENYTRSYYSKFNLRVIPINEKHTKIPVVINIVLSEFAERSFRGIEKNTSKVIVDEIAGTKYEYEFGGGKEIAIILPFGDLRMIIGTDDSDLYLDTFNQILASFKLLK
jgi:hypothetical protein